MTYIDFFKELGKQIITLNRYFGNKIASQEFEINPFGDKSVFIDKKAQEIIVESIIKQSIKCTLLSEESGLLDFGQKYPLFIVDPIDGSLNAKRGIPYSAFSIAQACAQTSDSIEEAYVLNLSNSDEFFAIKNKGSFLNNKPIQKLLTASEIASIEGIKRQTNLDDLKNIFKNFHRIRSMGSVALDLCYLAAGSIDVFFHIQPSRIIDYAAAKLVLEETGGGIFEWDSKMPYIAPIDTSKDKPFWALSDIKKLDYFYNKIYSRRC